MPVALVGALVGALLGALLTLQVKFLSLLLKLRG